MAEPFAVKDCSQITLATGRHAHTLREFNAHLREVEIESIYQHFWGGRLAAQFDEPEFQNDFASWVSRGLHDQELSEQLGILDPTFFPDLEDLRSEIVDIVEARLAQRDHLSWVQVDRPFSFTRGQIVVLNTHRRIHTVKELGEALPYLSVGSIFYHFIDARRRPPMRVDDFRSWLENFGTEHQTLSDRLAAVEPYFGSLADLRARLTAVVQDYLEN
ncbi:hypothetical protein KJ564_13260 [bacterium]|nr:hypothetical protein [bacterium]MBU1985509.1 hypothetical protein [bacterium]